MRAKLIKLNGEYLLNPSIVGSKLSLKNCQAIENGYDLDKLADEYFKSTNENAVLWRRIDFKAGFQKALEIIGDKKFSEEDVKKAMDVAINYEIKRDAQSYQEKIDFLKSLQQTQYDCEIVTTTIMENGKSGLDVPIVKPKLDADGCLILKRKI